MANPTGDEFEKLPTLYQIAGLIGTAAAAAIVWFVTVLKKKPDSATGEAVLRLRAQLDDEKLRADFREILEAHRVGMEGTHKELERTLSAKLNEMSERNSQGYEGLRDTIEAQGERLRLLELDNAARGHVKR